MGDIGSAGVTHAMITADGRAVPITIHPETGAYMTPDGQTLVTQEVDGQQVILAIYKICILDKCTGALERENITKGNNLCVSKLPYNLLIISNYKFCYRLL